MPKPNSDTRAPLMLSVFRPWTSKSENKLLSKQSSSGQPDPPKSFPRSSLDRLRSLPKRVLIPLLSGFRKQFAVFTPFSTSLCSNPQLRTRFRTVSNLRHLRLMYKVNLSTRFPKSWTPRLTDADLVNSYTLSLLTSWPGVPFPPLLTPSSVPPT